MTTHDLTLAIARRILANVEAGRVYAVNTVLWARKVVGGGTP